MSEEKEQKLKEYQKEYQKNYNEAKKAAEYCAQKKNQESIIKKNLSQEALEINNLFALCIV